MNIYINRRPVEGPWGGGAKYINAMYDVIPKLGHTAVHCNELSTPLDVAVIVGLQAESAGISAEQAYMYKSMMSGQRNVKLILRVNENDARKGTKGVDEALIEASGFMDGTVFVSNWLMDYFMSRGWECKNNIVIKNGVDPVIFAPRQKLNNDKINIVAHHWSNNELKGFDIYDKLDKFVGENPLFTFTYIGRDRRSFSNTKSVPPLDAEKLGEQLGRYDVYVSASRFDPGPNHISESISAGLPTYVHVDGGGCVEFAGEDHVYRSWEELESILIGGKFIPNNVRFEEWRPCIEQYVRFIESI